MKPEEKIPADPEPTPVNPAPPEKKPSGYAFGHDAEEVRRLETQGRLLAPLTRYLLSQAGVTAGMRVLDVGCGAGDVAFVVAGLVGPTGEVIGVDRADTVLSIAKARAQAMGLTNVRFVQGDIDRAADLAALGPFDAIVSRAIIPHLANPVDTFQKLLPLVRPGGVIGFHEPEWSGGPGRIWSTQKLAVLDEIESVGHKLVERGLTRDDAFSVIIKLFDEAGVTERRVSRTCPINSASDDDACAWIADMARTVYGIAQRLGLPLPSYDPKTVDVEFKKEVMSKNALFTPNQWLGATGRLPAAPSVEK